MSDRIILHIDINNCYASIECSLNPALKGKNVAVGGSEEQRHGIILAKNEGAKRYGVKTGEPIWQARQKCSDLVIVPPRYELYLKYSKAARRIYSDYTDRIEPFGIDECWIDITGLMRNGRQADGAEIADEIRKRIKSELGITVSVGVSFNKIFAKLGSDYKKPDAVTVISREGKDSYKNKVWGLAVEELLYVGRSTKRKLNGKGIYTIGELAGTPKKLLSGWLGKWGEYLWVYANGLDSAPVEFDGESAPIKSVSNGTTSYRDLVNDDDVKIVICALCESVASRLRAVHSKCTSVSVSIRNNMLYTYTRQTKLSVPTDDESKIAEAAMFLYKKSYNWAAGNPIRSISVCAGDLVENCRGIQLSMLDDSEKTIKHEKLNKAVDSLRERFGYTCVRRAVIMSDKGFAKFTTHIQNEVHPVGFLK